MSHALFFNLLHSFSGSLQRPNNLYDICSSYGSPHFPCNMNQHDKVYTESNLNCRRWRRRGWKATRMCASIEATTPSPDQQVKLGDLEMYPP